MDENRPKTTITVTDHGRAENEVTKDLQPTAPNPGSAGMAPKEGAGNEAS